MWHWDNVYRVTLQKQSENSRKDVTGMSVENEKEIQQLKNRIRELADKSYNQNQYTFTGFLGLAEQDALWQVEREVKFAGITLYGGREEAERKLLRFGSEAELGYEQPFPICCIRIRPLSAKFADKLSHRDYLGALMNLGIERSTMVISCRERAKHFCSVWIPLQNLSVTIWSRSATPT